MDFSDTQAEATFRETARAWISAHAPTYLAESLSLSLIHI